MLKSLFAAALSATVIAHVPSLASAQPRGVATATRSAARARVPAPRDSASTDPLAVDGGMSRGGSVFVREEEARTVVPTRSAPVVALPEHKWSSEWFTVPFVDAPHAPLHAGTVVSAVDPTPQGEPARARRFQRFDRLVVTLPEGVAGILSNALVLVRPGPDLRGGQVLIPTGLVTVESESRGYATVQLTRVYGVVEAGQRVIPVADPAIENADSATSNVPLDTRVVWISGAAELPTLYSAIVLSASRRDGVREGDRFELVTDSVDARHGAVVPATRVAVARVIRVTAFGATALIVSQQQPAIRAGMHARRIARMD